MTDARPTPEEEVVKHFRQQSIDEPPAHLDAFILAAAHRATPVPKSSVWQRWSQACQKPRWQVAFASLVGIALMLALVQPGPDQEPAYDFAPAPKASAPAPAAPMAELGAPAQHESISAQMVDEAKVSKRMAAPAKSLDEQLREVVRLQETGEKAAADQLFESLKNRFPNQNLADRLKQLQKNQ
ncbi:hypothetical protein [Pseudomonas violetae]|jgi:hypothetical protein|uniref:Anti-sigma factor n=1 Tax=Pseudomonas violetae TaxID=2915813 RepID=A0ABT0F454_9PSED|nr:hypothetical protein [Pseudomonas violetae]MCK1792414.1 hypothetical protein [Pseudomonas violetae]